MRAARTDDNQAEVAHVLCVLLPLKIESEANGREYWRVKAARVKSHRHHARLIMGQHKAPEAPLTITLTRIAPRMLDDDNLASGFKATRDGIADWLGIDDGDKRLKWLYAQRKGKPKQYAAEVVVESAIRAAMVASKGNGMIWLDDEYTYPLHLTGYASTLPADAPEEDRVEQLRKVVEEVTGKPLTREPARRIGFV